MARISTKQAQSLGLLRSRRGKGFGKGRSKYNVDTSEAGKERRTRHGILFDSIKEANRYDDLLLMQRCGEIEYLERQVKFRLVVEGELIGTYVADFVYKENGKQVVEDSKGFRTATYRMKYKLMKAIHKIKIFET